MDKLALWLAAIQGLYFLLTGIWSLASIRTFMLVTGPKIDTWLVKTVGVLVAVIGAVLCLAAIRQDVSLEIAALAIGSAAALAAVDVNYVLKRVIARIYLLDAAVEGVLIVGWILALL